VVVDVEVVDVTVVVVDDVVVVVDCVVSVVVVNEGLNTAVVVDCVD